MRNQIPVFFIAFTMVFISCNSPRQSGEQEASGSATAKAEIRSASGSKVQGTATFVQTDKGVRMTLEVSGLDPNGTHALHLHEVGDCSAADATSAGGHWNPTNVQHGGRHTSGEFHLGDIDNLKADGQGRVRYEIVVEDWNIGGSRDADILGKSVIIHEQRDDFQSQPTGDAGGRIGCGVISRQ